MSTTTVKEDNVKLSVQGVLFILKRQMIISHDWILTKILTSDIPWEKTSDDSQYYIDVDPTAFRLIISILTGVVDINTESNKMSNMDLVLLKATARYLMLDSLVLQIEDIARGFEKAILDMKEKVLLKEEEALRKEKKRQFSLTEMENKVDTFDRDRMKWEEIDKILISSKAKIMTCDSYRTHRPSNICGCKSIIIGPLPVSYKDFTCPECSGNRGYRYQRRNIDNALDLESLTEEILSLSKCND